MGDFDHSFFHIIVGSIRLVGPLGELWVVLPIAMVLVAWCLVSNEHRGALVIICATIVTLALVVLMKLIGTLFGPPWNPNWKWISTLFPSGHMAMGTVVYGALAVCVGRAISRIRGAAAIVVVVIMVLLGIQRVIFNVHPILDVLGGGLLGGLGLLVLLSFWPQGRLHPAGLPGVAVVVALILHVFYGREVPSSEILVRAAAQIHVAMAAFKSALTGN